MRIGLIGAPGVGKTTLAQCLVGVSTADNDTGLVWTDSSPALPNAVLLDGYVEKYGRRIDNVIGVDASWLVNNMLGCHREELERYNVKRKKSFVTCGTIVDTLVYAALQVELQANLPRTNAQKDRVFREMCVGTILSTMLLDTWKYTFCYFLPSDESTDFLVRYDYAVREVLQKFKPPVQELPRGLEIQAEAIGEAVSGSGFRV